VIKNDPRALPHSTLEKGGKSTCGTKFCPMDIQICAFECVNEVIRLKDIKYSVEDMRRIESDENPWIFVKSEVENAMVQT
jgi:hypothetical protein